MSHENSRAYHSTKMDSGARYRPANSPKHLAPLPFLLLSKPRLINGERGGAATPNSRRSTSVMAASGIFADQVLPFLPLVVIQ